MPLQTISRSQGDNLLYTADRWSNGTLRYISSHDDCFNGGNFILGGRLIDDEQIVQYGRQLTDTCINTHATSPTEIGPLYFAYIGDDGYENTGSKVTDDDRKNFTEHGWYGLDGLVDYYLQVPLGCILCDRGTNTLT